MRRCSGFSGPASFAESAKARCDYCGLGSGNTYCLYNNEHAHGGKCGADAKIESGVPDDEKRNIVDIHNALRK